MESLSLIIPTFVLPYKRFATPCLMEMAKSYLDVPQDDARDGQSRPNDESHRNQQNVSYQKTVLHNRCKIGYPISENPQPDSSGGEPNSFLLNRLEPKRDEPTPSLGEGKTGNFEQRKDSVSTECDAENADIENDGEPEDPSFHQSVVAPSTVWRFISWIGLSQMLDKAREMIRKQNPNSDCHRVVGSVDPKKYRTDDRQATLETARALLLVIPEWEKLHGCRFLPRFAIRSGFR